MNGKQRATLNAVFTNPVSGTIAWAAIEALLRAAGQGNRIWKWG